MQFTVYHCFDRRQKNLLRCEGVKIRRVHGLNLTYTLDVPLHMIRSMDGPLGGTLYLLYSDDYYLGYIYGQQLSLTPGHDVWRAFNFI